MKTQDKILLALICFVVFLGILSAFAPYSFADSISWNTSSGEIASNPSFTASVTSGNACAIFDLSGNRQNTYEGTGCGVSIQDLSAYVTDWGATLADWNGSAGTIQAGIISPYDGTSAGACTTYSDCLSSGYYSSDTAFEFCVGCGSPPPSPDTGTTTVMIVQDAAEQLYNAMILFFVSAAFIIWLMRK